MDATTTKGSAYVHDKQLFDLFRGCGMDAKGENNKKKNNFFFIFKKHNFYSPVRQWEQRRVQVLPVQRKMAFD